MADYYFTLQLNITNLCNLRCTHCYHEDHNSHGKLSCQDYCFIIDKFLAVCRKWKVKPFLIICGGEPFLFKQLDMLCEHYHEMSNGEKLSILTNATLLTSEKIHPFSKFNFRMIQVSLDGATPHTHDAIRGQGSFEKSIKGIHAITGVGLPVSINSVLTRYNHHQIESYFSLARENNVDRVTFTRFIPIGIGRAILDQMLSPLELKECYERIVSQSKKYGVLSNFNDGLFNLLYEDLGAKSPLGYTALVVADDGTILLSSRTTLSLGNALKDDLEDVWLNNAFLKAMRDRGGHECAACPHIDRCGGNEEVNFAFWGQFHRTDPQCWLAYNELPLRPDDTKRPSLPDRYTDVKGISISDYIWSLKK